jgi:hypothetical protein
VVTARAAAEEGRDLADTIGDRLDSRQCRYWLGLAQLYEGDPAGAATQLRVIADEAEAAHDLIYRASCLAGQGFALAWHGDVSEARSAAKMSLESSSELGGFIEGIAYSALGVAALAAGDGQTAHEAIAAAWQNLSGTPGNAVMLRAYNSQAELAVGDLECRPPMGRRRRLDCCGLAPSGGVYGASPGGDRAGGRGAGRARCS